MPIYELIDDIVFPPVSEAEPDGLLAIGGDLSPARVLYALTQGIFPWFNGGEPILWWAPDPRFVLFPEKVKISKSLKQSSAKYTYHINKNFEAVITNCATVKRKGEPGTWITPEMKQCYMKLHELGYAASFESYIGDELVGGLYGVFLGSVFIGESMFHFKRDASKAAFGLLAQFCRDANVKVIDCQLQTPLLESLGGEFISREEYTEILTNFVESPFTEND
jgi:leucyl/phenylalanyl-tRNA---protein transferase